MKLFALLTAVLAQDGPGVGDGRAMSLQKKIDNAQTKCAFYMNKAMVCHPPSGKIGKYTYRFDKVCPKITPEIFPNNYLKRCCWTPSITCPLVNAPTFPMSLILTGGDVKRKKN